MTAPEPGAPEPTQAPEPIQAPDPTLAPDPPTRAPDPPKAATHEGAAPKPPPQAPAAPKPKLFPRGTALFAGALLLGGAAVAVLSLVRGEPHRQVTLVADGARPSVTPLELAQWGVEGRRDYVVVDLRPSDDFKEGHIRGAVSCGSCHSSAEEAQRDETFVDLTKKLVLYSDADTGSMKLPRVLAANPQLYVLAGGYEAWQAQVMAPVAFGGERDEAQLAEKRRRDALRAFYAGERPATGNTAPLPVAPIKRQGAHAPAKPTEGC